MKKVIKTICKILRIKPEHGPEHGPEQAEIWSGTGPPSNAVFRLNEKLSGNCNFTENNTSWSGVPVNNDLLYITFLRFVFNYRSGNNLPTANVIQDNLNITKRIRIKLCKKAINDGVLTINKSNRYKINLDRLVNLLYNKNKKGEG